MKDELGGEIITEFVTLRPKTYSFLTDDGKEDKKAKGTKKCVIKKMIKFNDSKKCLLNDEVILKSLQRFISKKHDVYTDFIDLIKNKNEHLIKENNEIQNKVKKDEAKIRNLLNKFNDNMKDNMNDLYEKVKYKKKRFDCKLDKLDNDAKKLNNYIRENNDKIINTENKLDNVNNEYNNLLLEYNRLRGKFIKTKNKLYENENKLNKSEDDINELKKIKEKLNHQNTKMIEIESELNEKTRKIEI